MNYQANLSKALQRPTKNFGSKKPEYLSHRQKALKARKRRIAAASQKQQRRTGGQKRKVKRNKAKARRRKQ